MDYFDDFSDSYTTQDFVDEIHQKWYGEEEDDDDCEDHMEPMCTDARGSSYGCRYQYSSA